MDAIIWCTIHQQELIKCTDQNCFSIVSEEKQRLRIIDLNILENEVSKLEAEIKILCGKMAEGNFEGTFDDAKRLSCYRQQLKKIIDLISDPQKTKELLSKVHEEGCIHTEDNTTAFIKGGSVCPKFEIDKECIAKAKEDYLNNLIQ